jgi:hypothetical protein
MRLTSVVLENSRSSPHAKSLAAINSFKNNELTYLLEEGVLQIAMLAF